MLNKMSTNSLSDFESYVNGLMPTIKRQYDHCINTDLSQQNWKGLFKRNVIGVLKQVYDDSLTELQQLSFDFRKIQKVKNINGSFVRGEALTYFDGFADEFMQYALRKHRSSCALSNFPDEHNPSKEYINEVLQEANYEWEYFVFQAHSIIEM